MAWRESTQTAAFGAAVFGDLFMRVPLMLLIAAFVEIGRGRKPPWRGNKMRKIIPKYALMTLHSIVVITALAACSSYTPAERAQLQDLQEQMGREPFGE
jgi:hypothetical protein